MKVLQNEYSQNEEKYNELSNMFSHISDTSFYSTLIKIAVKEYTNYLNQITGEVFIKNSGYKSGQTFAIKSGDKFIVNDKLVNKCINNAHKKGVYQEFWFCKVNIVLDKLKSSLISRG